MGVDRIISEHQSVNKECKQCQLINTVLSTNDMGEIHAINNWKKFIWRIQSTCSGYSYQSIIDVQQITYILNTSIEMENFQWYKLVPQSLVFLVDAQIKKIAKSVLRTILNLIVDHHSKININVVDRGYLLYSVVCLKSAILSRCVYYLHKILYH